MSNSSKSARDNRANQLNPAHQAFHQSRGAISTEAPQRVVERPLPPEKPIVTQPPREVSPPSWPIVISPRLVKPK